MMTEEEINAEADALVFILLDKRTRKEALEYLETQAFVYCANEAELIRMVKSGQVFRFERAMPESALILEVVRKRLKGNYD